MVQQPVEHGRRERLEGNRLHWVNGRLRVRIMLPFVTMLLYVV
ncbi:hypothetical protein SAMN04244574_04192 [Azotobacter beijerinckii]|uniref:Uncharacterized protein n=1 Tax=Azotobacter beijerinckii TaxID=170623 RepID=A0A1I4HDU0_9GAMM|nr:hypothetical protein SAMN04244571_03580 [Azotobacter beijerinckii]SFL39681.1 hypothetical protein SAMN04244574_04192 [Azotobacter beijerinckii]